MTSKITKVVRPVYTTTDGTEFDDERKAEAHQAGVDAEPMIEKFVTTMYAESKERHRGTLRRTLKAYEDFKVLNTTGESVDENI